jgi:hypothetical protein
LGIISSPSYSPEVRRNVAKDSRGESGATRQGHWSPHGAQATSLPPVQWYVETFPLALLTSLTSIQQS